jgi:hypothetical protein
MERTGGGYIRLSDIQAAIDDCYQAAARHACILVGVLVRPEDYRRVRDFAEKMWPDEGCPLGVSETLVPALEVRVSRLPKSGELIAVTDARLFRALCAIEDAMNNPQALRAAHSHLSGSAVDD